MLYSLFLKGLLSYIGNCSKEFNFGKLPTTSLGGIGNRFTAPVFIGMENTNIKWL